VDEVTRKLKSLRTNSGRQPKHSAAEYSNPSLPLLIQRDLAPSSAIRRVRCDVKRVGRNAFQSSSTTRWYMVTGSREQRIILTATFATHIRFNEDVASTGRCFNEGVSCDVLWAIFTHWNAYHKQTHRASLQWPGALTKRGSSPFVVVFQTCLKTIIVIHCYHTCHAIRRSVRIVVSIRRCHRRDPGSIPGRIENLIHFAIW
jgi:hypothetical protein